MTATSRLVGIALTAAATYFLDPVSGRRRRAVVSDKISSLANDLRYGVGVAGRDLSYRARGVGAKARARVMPDHPDDEVLVERVRAAIGHVVSHPGAVKVEAQQGHVILSGDVLIQEEGDLLDAVQGVRGVLDVSNHLAVHDNARGISSLQGGENRRARRRGSWPPAIRLLAGIAGSAFLVHGATRKGLLSFACIGTGTALLTRSVTNAPLKQLVGAKEGRGIQVRKTLHVQAPVEQVFQQLDEYENFPRFMRNVLEVRRYADGRSHWVVAGPAGTPIEWDSVTTVRQSNEILGWRTVPGSTVTHSGIIRLRPDSRGGTQIDLQMSYIPPAGVLGHAVAKLFRSDPKAEFDEDLLRMKHFLETGTPPRDVGATHRPRTHH